MGHPSPRLASHRSYHSCHLGVRCGYVMRGGSLGVHTMHCFDTTMRRIRLLFRMTRSQAIPAAAWLFPPRSDCQSSWTMYDGEPGLSCLVSIQHFVVASGRRHMLGAAGIWSGADTPGEVSRDGWTPPCTASWLGLPHWTLNEP